MKHYIALLTFLSITLLANAQIDTIGFQYANEISEDSLRKHLMIIASDEFEGRETGKPGQKKAAEYIANHFERNGLKAVSDSGYFQRFYVTESWVNEAEIVHNKDTLTFIEDFYFFGPMVASETRELESLRFLGYGIDDSLYSDYDGITEQLENIVIWENEPVDRDGNYLLTGTGYNTAWSKDFSKKVKTAQDKGVKNLFIVNEDFDKDIGRMSFYLTMPRVRLYNAEASVPKTNVIYISPNMAKSLLGKKYKPVKLAKKIGYSGKPQTILVEESVTVRIDKESVKVSTENVLGLIEGSSKKDEYLVITSHYDHLGVQNDEIYNGADDDGSGTVALFELARQFSAAKENGDGPERSVLLMAVSGEEKGLLGSDYYTKNPVFPLNQTVANLNVDMIGRNDEAYEPDTEYIYLIGSDRLSTTLHEISEQTNDACCNIQLDYRYNDPEDPNRFYYRSDHYNFVKNDIPAIFYFSGVHEDYHQPGDTPDKIQYGKMTAVVKLIFNTAWQVANTARAIEVDVISE